VQAELSPQPGQLVGGKYRMIRVLGHGAMGVVYEAEHVATGKRVAIKWLHPHMMESRSAVERLVREAQASARVRHSNVVDVYDVEREADSLFLVMEYLEGEPLASMLERGGIPFHELLGYIVQAMRGVAEAHRQGIVHRDIKPENIFLAYESDQPHPTAKVLDFGISKVDAAPGGLSLTQTGSTLGTPLYMSYEQLSGQRDVDARSDIYAFGVILYEALTGTLPYEAENFAELAAKVITSEPIPPRALRPDIPEPLEQIVLWAMKKKRDERPPNLGVLVEALLPYTVPPENGRISRSSRAPSNPPVAVPALSSAPPPGGSQPPALRLDDYNDWNDVLARSQRSRREMEERVTALISGTMADVEYPRRKRSSSKGLWMAGGALATLVGGLAVAGAVRHDWRANAGEPPSAPTVSTPAPAQPATAAQAPAASAQNEARTSAPAELPHVAPIAQMPSPATEAGAAEAQAEAETAAPDAQVAESAAAAPAPAPAAPTATPAPGPKGKGAAQRPAAIAKPIARPAANWRPSGEGSESPPTSADSAPSTPPPPVEAPVAAPVAAPTVPTAEPPPAPNSDTPVEEAPPAYRAGNPSEEEF